MSCDTTYTTKRISLSSRWGDPKEWILLKSFFCVYNNKKNKIMSPEERDKLKKQFMEANIHLKFREVESGDWIKNAVRTEDDKASAGTCWKEYWQICTLQDYPTKCPFCGETLQDDDIDGCHIKVDEKNPGIDSRKWNEKIFIIPGHHKCNVTIDSECQAKIRILAVEAIKK